MSIILSLQELAFEEYLLQTAVLDRFCAPLCSVFHHTDQKTDQYSGERFIQQLLDANLFVIPLDTQGNWFRYHHLFRDLLLRQLEQRKGKTFIATLHHQASIWFADNDYIEEALHHALAGGDTASAVELVAKHRQNLLNEEQWHTLRRCLHLFPRPLIEEEPELLVATAWRFYNRSQFPDMVAAMDRAEALLARSSSKTVAANHHQAEIDTMRGLYVLVFEVDPEQALALSQRALAEIPRDWFNVLGLIYVVLGYSYLMLGEPEKGFAIIYDVLQSDKSGSSTFRARLLEALCYLHYSNADLAELGQAATQLLNLGQADNLAESISYGRYFLGCFHYLRNEMVEAEEYLVAAANDRQFAQMWSAINSACVLVLTQQALDRPQQAQDTVEATIIFLKEMAIAREMEDVEFLPQVRALKAELALRQNHLGEAVRWAQQFNPYPMRSFVTFYIPQFTLAKVLLAQGTTTSRKEAADLLAKLHNHVRNDKRYMIDVLILQAQLDDVQDDQVAALDKLERAIHLAEPGGFVRPFVDLGPQTHGLLRQLSGQGTASHYINQILDAFGTDLQFGSHSAEPNRPSGNGDQPPTSVEPVDPLTSRELDVLTLIAQGLSNKEIAAQLVITPGTVSQYTHIIYQKLMVKNRRQAVIKATKLGILPRE